MDKAFKPTTEWMTAKYAEMNSELFGGKLGSCDFGIFTTGRGSQGGVLGWFKITGSGIRIKRSNRSLYRKGLNGLDIYVDNKNFYNICKPRIELNGNYLGTEKGFLTTLVHEMCHYYTFMNGYVPVQCHGREFKEIANIVSIKSNGLFTIQRLASAEHMSELELNDEMKEKRAKRAINKKIGAIAVVIYKQDGQVRLILTKNESLINSIVNFESKKKDTVKILRSDDSQLIDTCAKLGYRSLMRSYRYWPINNKELLDAFDKAEGTYLYENPKLSGTMLSTKRPSNPQPSKVTEPKIIFSIKTSNGVFETSCNSLDELRSKLQQRFPNMNNETISKLMTNKNNFRELYTCWH